MSRLWRDELRAGLCPGRLVLARRSRGLRAKVSRQIVPCGSDPVSALKALADGAAVTVVLSNHFVRYAVLTGSQALKSGADWLAYAKHAFASTYGSDVSRWQIRLCPTGAPTQRVACAVDSELLEPLRGLPRLESIQPYLMAAFNARRIAFASAPGWLVLQEPARLAVALIEQRSWKLIRVRQADQQWQSTLADILDRETAMGGTSGCARVVICSEEETSARIGRYHVLDHTLPAEVRPHVMTLH